MNILGVSGMDGVTEYGDNINETVIDHAGFHAIVELGTFVEAHWNTFSSNTIAADRLNLEEDND